MPKLKENVPKGCPLSTREWQVVQGLSEGRQSGEIALELGVSDKTVRSTLSNAYGKLGVRTAPQAVACAAVAGWLEAVDTAWVDESLTPAQRLMVDAFDELLAGAAGAKGKMSHHLVSLAIEQGVPTPRGDRRKVDGPSEAELLASDEKIALARQAHADGLVSERELEVLLERALAGGLP